MYIVRIVTLMLILVNYKVSMLHRSFQCHRRSYGRIVAAKATYCLLLNFAIILPMMRQHLPLLLLRTYRVEPASQPSPRLQQSRRDTASLNTESLNPAPKSLSLPEDPMPISSQTCSPPEITPSRTQKLGPWLLGLRVFGFRVQDLEAFGLGV